MRPKILLPETVARKDGSGTEVALERGSKSMLLTLGITRIIEREILDVSVWGSSDGIACETDSRQRCCVEASELFSQAISGGPMKKEAATVDMGLKSGAPAVTLARVRAGELVSECVATFIILGLGECLLDIHLGFSRGIEFHIDQAAVLLADEREHEAEGVRRVRLRGSRRDRQSRFGVRRRQ